MSTALGAGATATATIDASGQVASVTVDNSGSNNLYAAPVVMIDPPPCTFAGCEIATASATIAGAPSYAGGLRKFIDTLPNLTVATPDIVTYPGTDYYEIELVEYTDGSSTRTFAATTLRGYHQTQQRHQRGHRANPRLPTSRRARRLTTRWPRRRSATWAPRSWPRRAGRRGSSSPTTCPHGSRRQPLPARGHDRHGGGRIWTRSAIGRYYPQNRGTLHLHGGFTPWISDGTPHQWIDPGRRERPPTRRASASSNVPDMPDPGAGDSMTFYYTNQQSARLMFYHDHAYGITRLNVYAGEAAGYLLDGPGRAEAHRRRRRRGPIPGRWPTIPAGHPGQDLRVGDQATGTGTWATDPTWNWGSAARQPLVPPRLHAEPEPVTTSTRRQRHGPLGLRPLVLAAVHGHHRHPRPGRQPLPTRPGSRP